MTRLDDLNITYQESKRSERSIDELFSQLESEILGTLYYLRNGSESAALASFDSLRARCEKYAQSGEVDNFRVLIFRIIYNEASSQRKTDWMKLKRRRSSANLSSECPLEDSEGHKKEQSVRDVILQTPFDDRAVFLLRQNGGLTYEQISKTVGESVENVKSRMRRTLTAITAALAPSGASSEA